MLVKLEEVLGLPSFRAASARTLTGDPTRVMVRWVHSSEVYEMGALLAGGEVLLTTGLGLHGRSASQLADYVDQVADAGCVGVALELGRSFFEVPPSMLAAAQRRGLVFITLQSVVPFERMVEDFHELILRKKLGSARSGEPLWWDLLAVVVAGEGLRALLDAVSRTAGCVVEYRNVDGRVVERSRISSIESAIDQVAAEVRGAAGPLGMLVLRGRGTRRREAIIARAATAVALELARHPGLGQRPSLAQSVVTDLAAGVLGSRGDVERRLTEAGWLCSEGEHLVVAAIDAGAGLPVLDVIPLVVECLTPVMGPPLIGAVGGEVVAVVRGGRRAPPQAVRASMEGAAGEVRRRLCVETLLTAVAAPVADLADLAGAVAEAREVLRSARRYGVRSGVVMARDVGVQRLLATSTDEGRLTAFVQEQIGALIAHDREHEADLVRTLDRYLDAGLSKTVTARALGIRRQSLYARLARIEKLLGVTLEEPAHLIGMGLALTAWRMRTGLDPQAAFDRSPRSR
ncbi:Purine catabolism regulatory protein-like family protein [Nocardioides dokdonensis FR1436]|uniref:Purine catabolism regulatory protein-like family protein n=1 Tax=Nocardioides dokdonensis FR1436 TaxID=1300347 RepID=A0A1A9GGK8_9ACTN|nr:PucR family transcriptional regulator [Nocardioides dokdonensis]ANH36772.1 Purine catabolism regulatory protein-like family protein [Nocardioides dokdonensis FR1436]